MAFPRTDACDETVPWNLLLPMAPALPYAQDDPLTWPSSPLSSPGLVIPMPFAHEFMLAPAALLIGRDEDSYFPLLLRCYTSISITLTQLHDV
jgi:hypothetical protein